MTFLIPSHHMIRLWNPRTFQSVFSVFKSSFLSISEHYASLLVFDSFLIILHAATDKIPNTH